MGGTKEPDCGKIKILNMKINKTPAEKIVRD